MNNLRVIISGGGTGGHIFPAISIADALKKRYPDSKILFVGAEKRMEMKRVPDAGYDIVGLPVAGFNRKHLLKNFKVLWMLSKSLYKARKVVRNFKPDIAIGVGGYASGPLLKMAEARGVPTLLQEQNSYPGLTNKFLGKKATKICVAYENMERFFDKKKLVLTGNPCRANLMNNVSRQEAAEFFDLDPTKKTILVVGGSLGSKQMNYSLNLSLQEIGESGVQIIWQAGELYFHELFLELPNREGTQNIRLYPFIDRMDFAYEMADLVISRAGAGAISELSLLKKPVILVPSPNVSEDHQTKNAMALVNKGAALLVADTDASYSLVKTALKLVVDSKKLQDLSDNISKMAFDNSADLIVDEVIKIVENRRNKK